MVVDAGNFSLNRDKIKDHELPRQRRTVELLLDGFAATPFPITALGIGERDLLMGGEWLMNAVEERHLPHVMSNLQCEGLNFVESRVHVLEEVSVEFLSFVSPTLLEKEPMGDFLTASSMLSDCTATEPITWLKNHPKESDIRVAFADLNRNEITSIAPYVDIVIESKIGKTTAEPEALDSNTVLFGVGSKGQNLGELSWIYDSTKSGFESGDKKAIKERDLTRRRERLKNLDAQRKNLAEDDVELKKIQRQLEYTKRSIAMLEQEISNIPTANDSVMKLSSNLVTLNKEVANHSETDKLIDKAQFELENIQ